MPFAETGPDLHARSFTDSDVARLRRQLLLAAAAFTIVLTLGTALSASEDYGSWEVLQDPFPSTGGNGIMIKGYRPVLVGDTCVTQFSAVEPSGAEYHNIVEFVATPTQGGHLCTDGKWRSADGSSSGTTPLRVFLKDGVTRRSP